MEDTRFGKKSRFKIARVIMKEVLITIVKYLENKNSRLERRVKINNKLWVVVYKIIEKGEFEIEEVRSRIKWYSE